MDNQFEKKNNKERKRTDALDVMFFKCTQKYMYQTTLVYTFITGTCK
jgi:hypothetical protein